MEKLMKYRFYIALVLLVVAVLSFTLLGDFAASPKTYEKTIESIDQKVDMVQKLTASSAIASAGISAIPGDTATPIADKLAEFTEYFLVVLCVLYSEKFLLTVVGAAAFRILIPVACVLLIIALYAKEGNAKNLGIKVLICALILYLAVPLSIKVSDMIYATCEDTVSTTLSQTETLTEKTDQLAEAGEDETLLGKAWERISETAQTLENKAAYILNQFVNTLAVFIVTSCIIPVLTLIFCLWIIKVFTGLGGKAIILPEGRLRKALARRKEEAAE